MGSTGLALHHACFLGLLRRVTVITARPWGALFYVALPLVLGLLEPFSCWHTGLFSAFTLSLPQLTLSKSFGIVGLPFLYLHYPSDSGQ